MGKTVRLKIRGDERDYKVVGVVSGQLMGPVVFMDKSYLDGVAQTSGGVSRLLVTTASHTAATQETAAAELERRLDEADTPADQLRDADGHASIASRASSGSS